VTAGGASWGALPHFWTTYGLGRMGLYLSQSQLPAAFQAQDKTSFDGTTKYAVCIYDDGNVLVADLLVDRAGAICLPGKPCWKAVSDKGYKFKDKATASDGVKKILGKGGDAEKGKVIVKAKNTEKKGQTNLPTGIAAALNESTQATVQVITSDASCFSMVASQVKKDDGVIYKAKVP
jgi:hypothetical protein